MTKLLSYDENRFPDLTKTQITGIHSCALYFVTTGRNAWHSTWVQQYTNGCMHSSIASAKQYTEKLRTQGTVFTIKQQPSICLTTDSGTLFVTQINCSSPLSDYSHDALSPMPKDGTKLIKGAQDNYLVSGANTQGAILSFERSSRFWRTPPPPKNSVIIIATEIVHLKIEPLPTEKLKAWSSYSNGSGYLLGWRERENDIKPNAIKAHTC